MGLIGVPSAVVSGAPVPPGRGGGALRMPLLKRKPATLPYPTYEDKVVPADIHESGFREICRR